MTPSKLRDILNEVKTAIQTTNPVYDLAIDRLHLYYNMQLVIFGIDKDKNLIIQFPVFIQSYTQQPLILLSGRDSTTTHNRPEHTGTILQTLTG